MRDSRESLALGQGKEEDHDGKGQEVRNQRYQHKELGQVSGRPGPLEIPAPMKEGEATYEEGKDVALDQGAGEKRPGVDDGQLRNQRQVGDDNVGILAPLSVSNSGAEERLGEERDENDPGDGRDVYARRHGDGCEAMCFGSKPVLPLHPIGRTVCL